MEIVFAILVCVGIISSFILAFTYGDHVNSTPSEAIRLSFKELKRFYNMAPNKYFFGNDVIQYYDEEGKAISIRLSLVSFLKYSIWVERLAKRKIHDLRDENMKLFIECTNKDIEAYKKETQQYLESILSESELKALAKRSGDIDDILELCKKLRIIAERMVGTSKY